MSRYISAALLVLIASWINACTTEPPRPASQPESRHHPPRVRFDNLLHLPAPDGTDQVISPGVYTVMPWEQHRLVLFPSTGQPSILVQAQPTEHKEQVTESVALAVPEEDNPDAVHLVLIAPESKGWDAAGTYSGMRSRGEPTPVSASRITQFASGQSKASTAGGGAAEPASAEQPIPHPSAPAGPTWVPNSAVPYNGVPPGAYQGGYDAVRPLFICHAFYNRGTHPGKVVDGRCTITHNGTELQLATGYEWLTNMPAQLTRWVPAQTGDGQETRFLAGSGVIGGEESGRTLLICHAGGAIPIMTMTGQVMTIQIPGIQPGKLVDGRCRIGYGGLEYQALHYEALTLQR